MSDWLRSTTEAADPIWQWLVIILAGAIPFIESYLGAALGVVAGVTAPIAIVAAVIGNLASMLLLVTFADKFRQWRKPGVKPLSERQQKLKRSFDKYGIAGVSLLGQTILPSQVTSMTMVAFGAAKGVVIFWQTISIIIWGTAFGLLAMLGVNAFI